MCACTLIHCIPRRFVFLLKIDVDGIHTLRLGDELFKDPVLFGMRLMGRFVLLRVEKLLFRWHVQGPLVRR